MYKHIVDNTRYTSEVWKSKRFQTAKVAYTVIQGHRKWRRPISLPLQPCLSILPRYRDIITYFPQFKKFM